MLRAVKVFAAVAILVAPLPVHAAGECPVKEGPRRPGDPPALVASSEKVQKELVWRPRYTELRPIIETAWNWHRKHPRGYGDRR